MPVNQPADLIEVAGMIKQLLDILLSRTWLLLLFLIGALASAWFGLSQIISGMERVPWVLVLALGVLVGWTLAATQLKTPWATLIIILLGIFFSTIFFAQLGKPVLALLRPASFQQRTLELK
jgi:hypothetical protein